MIDRRRSSVFFLISASVLLASPALAQIPGWDAKQYTFERIDEDRVKLTGEVEVNGEGVNKGQQIFADGLEWNLRTGEFTASGNVLVVSPTSRLAAEKVVFNTKTSLGTFYTASGIASLGERGVQDRGMFGTLEPDVYFYGEIIEKIGPDRYRITRGGFTTCVQPTPRWEIVSDKVTIKLEDYAVLRNAVIRVKDVPVFYLPVMYYPIQSDDRATGFLLPTYGSGTYQGQSLSNAFFWAINRSQDLTVFHDWFFKTGQGIGSEYRYAAAPGSEGQMRLRFLNEKAGERDFGNGVIQTTPARRSHEIRGGLTHMLPLNLRATGRVDYFSDIQVQQLYNQNIYESTLRQRLVNGSLSGGWRGLSVTGMYQRNELFFDRNTSLVNGYAPSLRANLSSRRLGKLPLYLSVQSETARVLYVDRRRSGDTVTSTDLGLSRRELWPTLRSTLTNVPFLSVNAQIAYRVTYYSDSLDKPNGQQIDEKPLTRRYAEMRAEILGPVFSKVYTPNNAFADRLKHVIEPNLSIQRTTSIEGQDRVVLLGSVYDYVVGGVTRLNYGLTNRFLLRKAPSDPNAPPAASSATSAPREFLTVGMTQSYYTDEAASRFDLTYQSSYFRRPSKFSAVAINARATPTRLTTASVRLEIDPVENGLQNVTVQGGVSYPSLQFSSGWSNYRRERGVWDSGITASTTFRFANGRAGGTYAFDWDIDAGTIIQQRWIGHYNAQCCGFAVEYQEYRYAFASASFPPQNRRFNFSFSLAGIGTFSNLFGAFGGTRY